ncbi:hypothetical protein [Serratia microhaemolytica]|uniref:hypothetical protein n=1 Tax=Serratia microhaemolytica TaxID=2675110 RepID=UPI000FDD351D|nr:hypothetical protein [Serratia microhaemolytica]
MNEVTNDTAESQPVRRRHGLRRGAMKIVLISVLLIGSGLLVSLVFLGLGELDQRLARLELQDNTVSTVEALSVLQTDVSTLKSTLQTLQASLTESQQQLAQLQQQVTQQAAQRQAQQQALDSFRQTQTHLQQTLQNALQTQEQRLNTLTEQFTTLNAAVDSLKLKPLSSAASATNLPAEKTTATKTTPTAATKTAAKKLTLPTSRVLTTVRAPFILTAIERRGTASWAAVAPRDYRSLSQITLVGKGDTVSGWTLVQTGIGQATFRVKGRLAVVKVEN